MKQKLLGFVLLFGLASAYSQSTLTYSAFNDLQSTLLNDKEHIVVLNFWATWCKPCVAELPDIEKIHTDFKNQGVRVVLANLDFHSQTPTTVPEFIKNRNLQSEVVHITDQDPNDFINKVDISWSGAIPATVIYYKGEKIWFLEGETNYETLKSIIYKHIQK